MRRFVLFAVVSLLAVGAGAQMDGMPPVVAPDGTVLVIRPAVTTDFRMTADLFAVSPAGTQMWKWEGGTALHAVTVVGSRVILARTASSSTPMHGGAGTAAAELVALSLASGTVQWRRDLTGMLSGIEAAGDRVYVVTRGNATMSGMPGRGQRQGVAVESTITALHTATGTVAWTVTLK